MSEKNTDSSKEKQIQFMALYNSCHGRFSRFCRAVSRDNEEARDLLSESVLRAYESFEKLNKPESFLYFLFSIASRLHKKKMRRLKFSGFLKQEKAEDIIDYSANPEEKLEVTMLFEAMQKLPMEQREALILFEITGMSLKEIQEIQHTSLSAVKARISRARQKLARMLKTDDGHVSKPLEIAIGMAADKLKTITINIF